MFPFRVRKGSGKEGLWNNDRQSHTAAAISRTRGDSNPHHEPLSPHLTNEEAKAQEGERSLPEGLSTE